MPFFNSLVLTYRWFSVFILGALLCSCSKGYQRLALRPSESTELNMLSQGLLRASLEGNKDTAILTKSICALKEEQLTEILSTNSQKMAFWINLYNALVQLKLRQAPSLYENRAAFFSSKVYCVAGQAYSLDDIEHELLRGGRWKYGLGYLGSGRSNVPEDWVMEAVDPRLHFALNCGAASCPPLHVYAPLTIDSMLDAATEKYLLAETAWHQDSSAVQLPAIMSWFRGDFGGKQGIRAFCVEHGLSKRILETSIGFKGYDWTLSLEKSVNDGAE